MKLKTIIKTAELEHLADIEREGDGIAIVMTMPRPAVDHTNQLIKRHLLPPAWGGTPVPFNIINPPIGQWETTARVNLAQSIRRMR